MATPLLVLVTLTGMGYALSQDKDSYVKASAPARREAVARNDVAPFSDKRMLESARAAERKAVRETRGNNPVSYTDGVVYSELRGETVPVEDMQHKNMQPHYKGGAPGTRQAPGMLARSAGASDSDTHIAKSERGQLFTPIQQRTVTTADDNDFAQARYSNNLSKRIEGERPFQPTQVGPGIGKGYDTAGVGGFQQFDVRKAANPPTIDSLRTADNQKQVYDGRVTGVATSRVPMRGDMACVQVKKPPTAFERGADTMLPTGGTAKAPIYGEQPLPDTLRGCTRSDLMGGAGLAGGTKAGGYAVEEPWLRYKQEGFAGPEPGVATRTAGAKPMQDPMSYSEILRDQERDLGGGTHPLFGTAAPTAGGRFDTGSRASAHVSQRPNAKSLTTAQPRMYGQMQGVNPSKLTVYNADDVLRTTIKETLIHDTRAGVASPMQPEHVASRDPDQLHLDPTLRNTLDSIQGANGDGRLDGTGAVHKATVYDPTDVPRTTDKDTLLFERLGNADATPSGTGYECAPRDVSYTQKQFLSDNSYVGGVAGTGRDGYKVTAKDLPETQRALTANNSSYTGSAGLTTSKAPMTYGSQYARAFNEIREMVLVGRAPNKLGAPVANGVDAIGAAASKKDPLLDVQAQSQDVQRQSTSQNYRAAYCEQETRATNKIQQDSTPRLDSLLSLQGNPYALKGALKI